MLRGRRGGCRNRCASASYGLQQSNFSLPVAETTMSTLSCSPSACHRADALNGRANPGHSATVCMSKTELPPAAQEHLATVPLLKIVDGKLQLDREKLEEMAAELPCARSLLRAFDGAVNAKRQRSDEPREAGPAKIPRPPCPKPAPQVAPATPPTEEAAAAPRRYADGSPFTHWNLPTPLVDMSFG